MLATRIQNNSIKVICTKNQLIDTNNLKDMYRTVFKFIKQNDKLPVIVEMEKSVQISSTAKDLFNKIESKCNSRTLVIIAG